MKPDRFVAVALALCVFGFRSVRSQSPLALPANLSAGQQANGPSRQVRTIPQVYGLPQRLTNVRTIPRLGGCWRGTIRAQDVTEQVIVGPFQLGPWVNEDYRICFGYDLHPQVSVAVTELQVRSSASDIVRADDSQVMFTNHLTLADRDKRTSSQSAFEIEQTTDFQGRAENGYLVVKATAIGRRNWTFAYQIAWQASFHRE